MSTTRKPQYAAVRRAGRIHRTENDGEREGLGHRPQGSATDAQQACSWQPSVNDTWLTSQESYEAGPHKCLSLRNVCMDQSNFILYEEQYRPVTQNGPELPKLDMSSYFANWRGLTNENKNIMGGLKKYPEVIFRPPLLGDEKEPHFSTCTLPIVFYKSHEDNFCHVIASLLPQLYSFHNEGGVNQDVTYVMGTLHGLPVPGFVHDLIRPFSKYEVQTLAEFSSRLPTNFSSSATAEGRHVRCFDKALVCQILDMAYFGTPRDMAPAAEHVFAWYKDRNLLPINPAGFSKRQPDAHGDGRTGRLIRVLVIVRKNTREILNRKELMEACNAEDGLWECREFRFGSGLATDMAAVHSADVLLAAHGAGNQNFIFMRKGAALLEVNPMGWMRKTEGHEWSLFIPTTADKMGHKVRYFAINIADPELSEPSIYEKEGWVQKSVFEPKERDRNMRLPWAALKETLERIKGIKSQEEYLEMRRDGDNVLDLLPGGVLQRTPVPNEMYGEKRLYEGKTLGETALQLIQQGKSDLKNAKKRLEHALELAKTGVLGTRDAIHVLENRKKVMAKTNESLISMLNVQHEQNNLVLSRIKSSIGAINLGLVDPESD
eukprot:jgi/Botrbrau1/10236/Bobra.0362s0025.1